MPRNPRTVVVGYPHHVIQRGHNRCPLFDESGDFQKYLSDLKEQCRQFDVDTLAYCLMTNHVHLILFPKKQSNSISKLMKVVAGRYTRFRNKKLNHTGTAWEGRFRCSVIDTNEYLAACCRYVDLNPVRAQIVKHAKDYRWSSYRALAGYKNSDFVNRKAVYESLDLARESPQMAYRRYVRDGISETELEEIRTAVRRNQLTGSNKFIEEVKSRTGQHILSRGRGRPAATNKNWEQK